jgi:hypothetical protein
MTIFDMHNSLVHDSLVVSGLVVASVGQALHVSFAPHLDDK